MSREAMELALEALSFAATPMAKDRQKVLRAQSALREALAEQPALLSRLQFKAPKPAQRKPLTEEEMYRAIRPLYATDELARLALQTSKDEYRAIEAAHGIGSEK